MSYKEKVENFRNALIDFIDAKVNEEIMNSKNCDGSGYWADSREEKKALNEAIDDMFGVNKEVDK